MKCPGQDMQYWKDDAIFEVNCPECDSVVEFYKDDTTRKCPKCSKLFWKKEEDIQYADENTLKIVCNHCHQVLRIPLITEGANAGAPKMGH